MTINVIIVDDSAVVRQVLTDVINKAPDMKVSDVANDPIFAYTKMQKRWPDVIVLDIEMPRMDGITFLKQIMAERPTPVVICSSLAQSGAEVSIQALEAGAFDIVSKPKLGIKDFLESADNNIVSMIRAAAIAKVGVKSIDLYRPIHEKPKRPQKTNQLENNKRLTAIGCSTGGTTALEFVLTQLTIDCPGIVIVQHMPKNFTKAFAERLNSLCEIEVLEASSGDSITPGKALIAPGGKHLQVKRSRGEFITIVTEGPAVNRHCPSVDVLFKSIAQNVQEYATGVLMTGMGNDGAKGLLAMKNAGCTTLVQDEQSSVVFGMPKEAIKLGAAKHILNLNDIAAYMNE